MMMEMTAIISKVVTIKMRNFKNKDNLGVWVRINLFHGFCQGTNYTAGLRISLIGNN